jgi:hypothetical protein
VIERSVDPYVSISENGTRMQRLRVALGVDAFHPAAS